MKYSDPELIPKMCFIAALLLIVLMFAGCGGTYVRLGLGHQIDDQTDYWLQTDRDWQCHNPSFHGEVGYEFADPVIGDRAGIAFVHDSWLLCGSGLNDKPETYTNRAEAWVQWGGR